MKYFTCDCARCEDPEELGTHLNSIFCQTCDREEMSNYLEGYMLPVDNDNQEGTWRCKKCGAETTGDKVISLVKEYMSEVENLQNNDRYSVHKWLDLRKRAEEMFHPQHEVMCQIAKWVLPIMCRPPFENFGEKTDADFKLKEDIASRYLKVINILKPGISMDRAKAMFEYVEAKSIILKRRYDRGEIINVDEVKECKTMIEEMNRILSSPMFRDYKYKSAFENFIVYQLKNLDAIVTKLLINHYQSTSTAGDFRPDDY